MGNGGIRRCATAPALPYSYGHSSKPSTNNESTITGTFTPALLLALAGSLAAEFVVALNAIGFAPL
jgi:hypothetical protein